MTNLEKTNAETVVAKATEAYIKLSKYACKKMGLKHVTALYAEDVAETICISAVTPQGKVVLDFWTLAKENSAVADKMIEAEMLIKTKPVRKKVIAALCAYGQTKEEGEKVSPSKVVAENLIALAKWYVEDNEIENPVGLYVDYEDGILDLYLMTENGSDLIDLEELVEYEPEREQAMNAVFGDDVLPKHYKAAKKIVEKYKF